MRKTPMKVVLFALALFASFLDAQSPSEPHKAPKIVSLAPHITELLYAVGAGDQIVGAVEYSDYPEAANQIPRIGDASQINYERILELGPDIVFAWTSGNGAETIAKLESLGLQVHTHNPEKIEDIAHSLREFGELTGHRETGREVSEAFLQRLQLLRDQYSARAPVDTFYQLWDEPIMTVNGQHIISDVIRLCGGENVFAKAIPLIPKIGVESLLAESPEVIIASGMAAERPQWLGKWKQWPSLPAAKNGHLYSIHPDLLHRHSPRILDGAMQMCEHIDQARHFD